MDAEFVEKERVSPTTKNGKSLFYPLASTDCPKLTTRGKYKLGYPEGAIVHFTSGRSLNGDSDAVNNMSWARDSGFCYFTISNTGKVFQGAPLDEWGYHAGSSSWDPLGKPISPTLVGIEVACAGKLTRTSDGKFISWFGEKYSSEFVRYNGDCQNIQAGWYHRFTRAQEDSLLDLLLWLKWNNEKVFNFEFVLGHDEVSPSRKNDPGASMSTTMPCYRRLLKERYPYFSSIMV